MQVWSARSLILCVGPRLRANIICYLRFKTTSFVFFTLFFFFFSFLFLRVLKENNRLTTAIMLCTDDTLHQEDVLMILDALEVLFLPLCCLQAANNSLLPALHFKDNNTSGLRQSEQPRTRLRSRLSVKLPNTLGTNICRSDPLQKG